MPSQTIFTQARTYLAHAAMLAAVFAFAACQSVESQRINIATYAPVIDVKGQGYDVAKYNTDLNECRFLGMRVQATYEEQRKKEQSQALQSALIGAVAGAAIGQVSSQNSGSHSGRALTAGALTGAAIGADIGAEAIDYDRAFVKFGPTGIVDKCMTDRGYKILSLEGFGGG